MESAVKGRPMRNEVGLGAERHYQLGREAGAPLPCEMLGDTQPHSVAPYRAIFMLLADPGLKPKDAKKRKQNSRKRVQRTQKELLMEVNERDQRP